MAFFLKSALTLSLPPFIVTFAILLASLFASKRELITLSRFLTALAIALGYAVGHRIATGSFALVPKSVEDWLPLMALFVAFVSLVENLPKLTFPLRSLLRLVFSVAAIAILLLPLAVLGFSAKLGWALALGFLLTLVWTGLDELAERKHEAVLPLALSLVTVVSSASLFISHSAQLSQLAGVLSAVLGSLFIFNLWQRQWSMAKGASGVVALILFSINVNGIFYANLPLLSAIFLWLAALSGLLRLLPFSAKLNIWLQFALQLTITLLLSVIGFGIAVYTHGLPTGGY